MVVQDMMALKYGMQLDEFDFVSKAKARCTAQERGAPRRLCEALNAEPALKVKDASNERLIQLHLRLTTVASYAELQGFVRRWPGTACAVAAVGLGGADRNVQFAAVLREAYGDRDVLVAKTRAKAYGGVGPLHMFAEADFQGAVVLEPAIEHVLKYEPEANVMIELKSPPQCPEFEKSAVAFDAEAALSSRALCAAAALAPRGDGPSASCLLAKELMVRHPTAPDIQTAGCKVLGSWLRGCQSSFSDYQAFGTVEAVAAAMRRHSANARLQEAAASALSSAASWPAMQAAATNNGATEEIVSAMRRFPTDPELLAAACSGLAGLAANHPLNQSALLGCRSIEVIVSAMDAFVHHARLQTMACGALGNLAANSPNNQAAIASRGGLQRVVNVLQHHQSNPVVLAASLGAVWCLMKQHLANTEMAAQLGVAELSAAALQRHPEERGVRSMASCVLQSLVPGLSEALAVAGSGTRRAWTEDTASA